MLSVYLNEHYTLDELMTVFPNQTASIKPRLKQMPKELQFRSLYCVRFSLKYYRFA